MKKLKLNIGKSSPMWSSYDLSSTGGYNYYSANLNMGVLINGPKNGRLTPTKGTVYTCREQVSEDDVRKRITTDKKKMDKWFKRTRVLMYTSTSTGKSSTAIDINAEAGVHTVKMIEKAYGWPLSKIYRLENDKVADKHHFYYIEGCGRWVKAPAMLSLYLLLLRLGRNVSSPKVLAELKKKRSMRTMIAYWKAKRGDGDVSRFREVAPSLKKMLDNYQKLFGSRDIYDLYKPNHSGYLFGEGVQKLLRGGSSDTALRTAWAKVK